MCGITGYVGQFGKEELQRSIASLVHRGPDDGGLWLSDDARIGLGHRRLSILDLSAAGHQPMAMPGNAAVITYNGEIYNFRELRKELEQTGARFRGHSDTEVVLRLYEVEGVKMLSRLNGIFAFALWDHAAQTVLLARDAFGVKPLYYAQSPRGVVFASELKAILAMAPDLADAGQLDPVALNRYLSFLWCPGNETPLRRIKKLGPGEAMSIKEGRITRHWRWYELPATRNAILAKEHHSFIAATAQHLRTAVERQMVADVPVGAFLSGGLDSSAIVAFAAHFDPAVRCFTIDLIGGQEAGTADDLPFARAVASHLGVKLDAIPVDAGRMAADLPAMVAQLDEPLADPAPLNALYISRLARQCGINVLLSGTGGDDLFSGYRRHRALMAERYWAWLPRSLRSAIKRSTKVLDRRNAAARRIAKLFHGSDLDGDQRIADYFVWADANTLAPLYTEDFRARIDEPAERPLLEFLERLSPEVPSLERMLALEQRFFLADHNLIYTDKMSMAAGVEARVPFLDIDLVEFAFGIPARLKQRGSIGKWVLKKAMEPYLPKEVIYRPKTGFGAPLRRWLRHELRDVMQELLSSASLSKHGIFDPQGVAELIKANDSGRVDGSYTLFALMSIELWCRHFVDSRATIHQRPEESAWIH